MGRCGKNGKSLSARASGWRGNGKATIRLSRNGRVACAANGGTCVASRASIARIPAASGPTRRLDVPQNRRKYKATALGISISLSMKCVPVCLLNWTQLTSVFYRLTRLSQISGQQRNARHMCCASALPVGGSQPGHYGRCFNRLMLLALVIPAGKGQFGWGMACCIHGCVARVLQHRIGQQIELLADAGVNAAAPFAPV